MAGSQDESKEEGGVRLERICYAINQPATDMSVRLHTAC